MVIVTSLERNVNITIRGNCIFLEKGDGCPGTVPVGCLLSGRSRRLGDGSKPKEAVYKRYRMHSPCFLMKTQLKASSPAVWETADALLYAVSFG